MPVGLPEWPDPAFYEDWRDWARETISVLNEQLVDDYSEVGKIVLFAVSLPPNGKWLEANGSNFLSASFPELAQKLGTTFGSPGAGLTTLPTVSPAVNHVPGIKAI